ncbi:MAG: LysR family transcriptional regulator [Gordonia sp. (in: high G+C Gram-positive bacteria)]|nr:MAG: LysR family transcriptional regulator [Gordonia sp. (in: high G+C Gram-positive bacteria)]
MTTSAYHPLDIPRYTLRQLAYFVTAADLGTTSAAAQAHVMSQSAMSSALSDLEAALGVQLLIRNKAKGVSVTEVGKALLPQARALLAGADEFQAQGLAFGHELSGRLVIGCHTTIAPFVLPRLLHDFGTEHPAVELDFVEGSLPMLEAMLLEGNCEVAITYDFHLGQGIERRHLYTPVPHVLLSTNHPLADEKKVSLATLAPEPVVFLDVAPSEHVFRSAFEAAGAKPNIRYRTVSFEHARALVARELGYTLLTQRVSGALDRWGSAVVSKPLSENVPSLPIVLATAAGVRHTRRAQAFSTYCAAALRHDTSHEERGD